MLLRVAGAGSSLFTGSLPGRKAPVPGQKIPKSQRKDISKLKAHPFLRCDSRGERHTPPAC
jgi:hypothetical protein